MRGEGWLYGGALLVILGAGAWLLLPGGQAGPGRRGRTAGAPVDPAAAVAPAASAREAPAAPAVPEALVLEVGGPEGALRGELEAPVGATLRRLGTAADGALQVELTAHGPLLALAARGHVDLRLEASALRAGQRLVLPHAAPALVVRVREADGAPAADVPVEVLPAGAQGPWRTDAGGTVVLDRLPAGLVQVRVGGQERTAPVALAVAGRERDLRVVLDPPLLVRGQVLSSAGRPVAGARVEARAARGPVGRAVRSGADGRFVLACPVEAVLALCVEAEGQGRVAHELRPERGALELEAGALALAGPEVEVTGRVRGVRPGPGAHVLAEPAVAALLRELVGEEAVLLPPVLAPLREDGSYELRGLPGGVPLRLSLRGAGLPEDALFTPQPGDRTRRDFEPVPGERLELWLTQAGRPVAWQRVLLSPGPVEGDALQPGDREAWTDAGGCARLADLPAGTWFVRACRAGCAHLRARVELPQAAALALELVPAPTGPRARRSGRVSDDRGRPLPGVTLRAAGVVGTSDGEGRFALEGVESLAPRVRLEFGYEPGQPVPDGVDARDYPVTWGEEVRPGSEGLSLMLPGGQALAFRAIDRLDDTPVAWLRAVARDDAGRTWLDRTLCTRDGRYLLAGLPRTGLTLTLLAPGRRLVRLVPLERAAREAGAPGTVVRERGDVGLLRGLVLEGEVTGAGGQPLPGARAALLGPGWLATLRGDPAPRRELDLRVVAADARGRGVQPLQPHVAAAAVVLWAPGHAPTLRRALYAEAPAGAAPGALERLEARIDARLRPGTRLQLSLSDLATREPVHGAVLDLESARNGSAWLDLVVRGVLGGQAASLEEVRAAGEHLLWEAREEGLYVLGPVEPGEYELLVEHPLYLPERRKLPVLDPASPLSFEQLLPEPGARLDPRDPASLARVQRGPEVVTVYGSDKMRFPVAVRRRPPGGG
ncbi:MAG: hypothetical protein ACKOSS_05430 [Planctomycetia bacterium]